MRWAYLIQMFTWIICALPQDSFQILFLYISIIIKIDLCTKYNDSDLKGIKCFSKWIILLSVF
jgi:hypothetical protein